MTVTTKLLVIESLSDKDGTLIAHVDFPISPLGLGPFYIDGTAMIPVLGAWEINTQAPQQHRAMLVLRMMTEENAAAAQKTMQIMRGGSAMRQGASGPVLDLNAMRRGDS